MRKNKPNCNLFQTSLFPSIFSDCCSSTDYSSRLRGFKPAMKWKGLEAAFLQQRSCKQALWEWIQSPVLHCDCAWPAIITLRLLVWIGRKTECMRLVQDQLDLMKMSWSSWDAGMYCEERKRFLEMMSHCYSYCSCPGKTFTCSQQFVL